MVNVGQNVFVFAVRLTRLIAVSCAAVVVLVPDGASQAGELKFVNSKAVAVVPKPVSGSVAVKKWNARLSDNGRYLLHIRSVHKTSHQAGVTSVRTAFRLVLSDLKNSSESGLPGVPIAIAREYIGAFMSMRIFNAAGTKIVVPYGVDTDGDGWYSLRKDKMCLGIYDIATGKITKRNIPGQVVLPTFDRSGKKLLVMGFENTFKNTGKLYYGPGDGTGLKQLKAAGMPHSPCPTADVVPLSLVDKKWVRTLILYDPTKNAKITDIPMHKSNSLSNRIPPHWTRDGRYLCYVDVKVPEDVRADRKRMVRIWDRKAGKVIRTLKDFVPAAPGPTPTTMIIESAADDTKSYQLHDAATGKSRPIESCLRIVSTNGRRIVYTRREPDRSETIYVGQLQLTTPKDK